MKWITRERPKVDRIACPWLIARFIDRDAEFIFVPPGEVAAKAADLGATPYDENKYSLHDAALHDLAAIVRGANSDRLDLAPQCAGLLAISLGLSARFADDHEQLRHGFVMYDALYAWLKNARHERHDWNPQRIAA